jgi:Tfp pilus assembly protein PilF
MAALIARFGSLAVAWGMATCTGCNVTNGGFNNHVGTSFYRQGNYTMARDEFQRAAANDPVNADYVHNMAAAMKRQGDIAGSERTYRQAIALDPGHQPSYHGLALLLKEQGRTDEAASLLQGWVDQQPYSSEPYIELAWWKRETGDLTGSEQLLMSALRVKPNDYIATAQLGQLYQDTNQPDRAIAMYRRSLYTRWNQPEVQSRIAQLQRQSAPGGGFSTVPVYAPARPAQARYGNPAPVIGPGAQFSPDYAPLTGGLPTIPAPAVAGYPAPYGASLIEGDTAHAGQLNPDTPLVQPY